MGILGSDYKPMNSITLPQLLSQSSKSKVKVKAGDNWVLVGRKGSGKTTFGKRLLQSLRELYPTHHTYVLDIKMRDFQEFSGIVQSETAPPLVTDSKPFQIWQPLGKYSGEIERWLYTIRTEDAPAIVYIDELLALQYTKTKTSIEFRDMQRLGRNLPIITIAGTQELVEIPRSVISQGDHYVRFRLKHPYEQHLMDRLLGKEVDEPEGKYGFYYNHADSHEQPDYFDTYEHFF